MLGKHLRTSSGQPEWCTGCTTTGIMVTDWFHLLNKFSHVIGRVAGINPDKVGQKLDMKYLHDKYIRLLLT